MAVRPCVSHSVVIGTTGRVELRVVESQERIDLEDHIAAELGVHEPVDVSLG
jgi:hypothetical protein